MTRIRPIAKSNRYAKRPRIDYTQSALPKDPPKEDPKFRGYVKNLGCQVRRRSPKKHARCTPVIGSGPVIDFSHVPAKRGLSQKASDRRNGIGMCHDLHIEQHTIGWPRFARKYDFDPLAVAVELADSYERRYPQTAGAPKA